MNYAIYYTAQLVKAVREVSRGEPSADTDRFLKILSRPLAPELKPVELYAENYDVENANAKQLRNIPGHVYFAFIVQQFFEILDSPLIAVYHIVMSKM